jgi:site-specific DNA-methyltransferase (adenine-specific)
VTIDLHTQGFLDALGRIDARKRKKMSYQILKGNSLDLLPTLADNSIDAIVTDPPYGLGNPDPDYIIKAIQQWASGDRSHIPEGKGFMGKSWDSFVPPPAIWDECLRVLKPGGHLLAFAGTRTYDLMGISIRMAGFEIRDSIGWVYGSGFPKSLDVSKAIDKAAGAEREVIGTQKLGGNAAQTTKEKGGTYASNTDSVGVEPIQVDITAPSTPEAKQWQGWGTALKPALEPIVVARKPLGEKTVAENVLTHGTGGLNIDASRIGTEQRTNQPASYSNESPTRGASNGGEQGGFNYSSQASPSEVQGRWPANLILSHAESCQPTGKTIKSKTGAGKRTATFGTQDTQSGGDGSGGWSGYEYETEVYECVEGCPVKTLDEQSGQTSSKQALMKSGTESEGYRLHKREPGIRGHNDTGGASRFFYVAKASKRDRNEGLEDLEAKHKEERKNKVSRRGKCEPCNRWAESGEGDVCKVCNASFNRDFNEHTPMSNFHPTVKPTALMQYLVKLVTPPGGTVLDPFTGSGSTGKAAILEGFDFIGIELTEDYWPIIEGRLKHAEAKVAEAKENQEAQPEGLF